MKLIESDPSLSDICRTVEERVRGVSCLRGVSLPVVLLPHFNNLGFPVTRRDPTAYNRPNDTIFANACVFLSLLPEVAQFALAHEIGHHTHDVGITTSAPEFKAIHTCLIADWLAAQWGFHRGMRIERSPTRGEEFRDRLTTISSEREFIGWIVNWEIRFKTAALLGKPIDPVRSRS